MKKHVLLLASIGIGFQCLAQTNLTIRTSSLFNDEIKSNEKFYLSSNSLLLNEKDKEEYFNYFTSKIKSKEDYIGVSIIPTSYIPLDKENYIQIGNVYYFKGEEYKINFISENNTISKIVVIPKFDPETGEQIVDDEGNPIYIEDAKSYPLKEVLAGIAQNEEWKYKKGEFTKKSVLNKTLINKYGADRIIKDFYYEDFSIYTPKKTSYNKKDLFKNNISYDYIFYPSLLNDSIRENLECFDKNNYLNQYDANEIIKQKDSYTSEASIEKTTQLIKEIIYDLENGTLKITNLNNKPIPFTKDLISVKKEIPLFDEETFTEKVDENGNVMYFVDVNPIHIEDVIGFTFTEDWYFGKNQLDIVKKVKSISLIAVNYDSNGEIDGFTKLPFKILLD